jgi:hypothetical protein
VDDIKLYASKKNHILSLLTITENFSNDIGMSFGIDKCKMQSICRGHYEHLEYTGCPRTRGSNLQCVFLGDN